MSTPAPVLTNKRQRIVASSKSPAWQLVNVYAPSAIMLYAPRRLHVVNYTHRNAGQSFHNTSTIRVVNVIQAGAK